MLWANLAFWLAPGAAAADLFTVTRVQVDVTAESSAQARARALQDGQRQAFTRLLRRITLRADWPRLPPADQGTVERAVQGIEIAEERATATRYFGALNVTFKRDPVRSLLRDAGIPFTEAVARPVLVLPVLGKDGKPALWGGENPWRESWGRLVEGSSLTPIVLAKGDEQDQAGLSAEQAMAADQAPLLALARRYGTTAAWVVTAVPEADHVNVASTRGGAGAGPAVVESFPGDASADNLGRIAQVLMERHEESWKQQTLLRFDDRGQLIASAAFRSFNEWQRIRERLNGIAELRRVEITALTHRDAQLTLSYIGDPVRLATVLAQRDIELSDRQGYWQIRLTDGATSSAPARRAPEPEAPKEEAKPAQ